MHNFTIIEIEQIEMLFPGVSSTEDEWRVNQIPQSPSPDAHLTNELKINLLILKEVSMCTGITDIRVLGRNHEYNAMSKIDLLISFC